MRPVRNLGIYIAAVLAGGAIFAPWLHAMAAWGAPHADWVATLSEKPFHRYVSRSLMILALVGLWPFLRSLRADSWESVGLRPVGGEGKRWFLGFVIGFISLAVVAFLALQTEATLFKPRYTSWDILRKSMNAALSALVVGVLEELLFRGVVFGALRRAHHWIVAAVISGAFYSFFHFFQRPPTPEVVHWYTGVVTLGHMLRGLADPATLIPGFFSLTLAGGILAYGYQRTRNLYFSIGLHSGWVFWLKFYGATTTSSPDKVIWFWGTGKLYDGWLSFLMLTAVWVGCILLFRRKKHGNHTPA